MLIKCDNVYEDQCVEFYWDDPVNDNVKGKGYASSQDVVVPLKASFFQAWFAYSCEEYAKAFADARWY
ncbi:hypothetical protein [Blackfly microvirus SF02]|uniref:Uncharacterized protein n=1 Tax=Blackfly microvirus SF02 TaxID=2576452 RepID=A0A4V1F5C6_9VIRU|nr:hypothetical protein [Blackfly microvirus SF02]